MNIEILWFEACPNRYAARDLVEEVLAENRIEATIDSIEVPDLETGERVHFPGSPTIRINGRDVEPDFTDTGEYTPRCRIYLTESGYAGVPEREWIEESVSTAMT